METTVKPTNWKKIIAEYFMDHLSHGIQSVVVNPGFETIIFCNCGKQLALSDMMIAMVGEEPPSPKFQE